MRNYFRSFKYWLIDVLACYVVAAIVTPADPLSAWLAFAVLFPIWMLVRWVIYRRLNR